jgi:hypothetical protein
MLRFNTVQPRKHITAQDSMGSEWIVLRSGVLKQIGMS